MNTPSRVKTRAESIARKRARAAALEAEALTELVELVPAARECGTSLTRLAELAGYKTTKPVYDAMRRRGIAA